MPAIELGPFRGWAIQRAEGAEKTLRGAWLDVLLALSEGRLADALAILEWEPEPGRSFVELLSAAVVELPAVLRAQVTPEPQGPTPEDGETYWDAMKRLARTCTTCGHSSKQHRTGGYCRERPCTCPSFEEPKDLPPDLIKFECPECLGRGWPVPAPPMFVTQPRCSSCHGSGRLWGPQREADEAAARRTEVAEARSKAREEHREAQSKERARAELQGEFDAAVDEVADRKNAREEAEGKPPEEEPEAWPFASPREVVVPFMQRAKKGTRTHVPRHEPGNGDPYCVLCGKPCFSNKDAGRKAVRCRNKHPKSDKKVHESCYQAALEVGGKHGW